MLYVSLDESGNFENAGKKSGRNELAFIGGLIYDDLDRPNDYKNEQKRINLYLESVCKQENAEFPGDLHYENEETAPRVKRVRGRVWDTLGKFLQEGTCDFEDNEYSRELRDLPEREGRYHLFFYAKYGVGLEQFLSKGMSNLLKDDVASNLYEHMITEVLGRNLFHNPVLKEVKKVQLDLPTRSRAFAFNSDQRQEYQTLGFRGEEDRENKPQEWFTIANADVYRTALEREMIRSKRRDIQIDKLRVRPIPYKNLLGKTENFAFLYLTDLLCGISVTKSSPSEMIENVKGTMDSLVGRAKGDPERNLVFVYDEIDLIYKEALEKLEQKDYYEVLQLIYRGEHSKSPYAKYYADVWFPCLLQRLHQEEDIDAFSVALRKYYLSTRQNNIDQEELVEIFSGLDAMAMHGKMDFRSRDAEAVLYELYDAGASAFCHIGDSAHAEECYDKCDEYSDCVELERFLRTRNKMVVFKTDMFCFREALDIAEKDEEVHDFLSEARETLSDSVNFPQKEYGVALSQTGQILSFLHRREAEQKFLSALDYIGEEGTPDYNQTLSYLLHYYLDMGEKEKYEEYSIRYFGGKTTLKEQFRYIIKEGAKGRNAKISLKFSLFVFIKGIYLYHRDDKSKDLKMMLDDIEKRIFEIGGEEAVKQINNHPWEIIYKYLALIELHRGAKGLARAYMDKTESVLGEKGFTLKVVCQFGWLEYAIKSGDMEEAEVYLQKLAGLLKEQGCAIYEKIDLGNVEGSYQYLKDNALGFMYS